MDGLQFDIWTRRRFGLAAGGVSAALLALASPDDIAAKKKHRHRKRKKKKKCKKLGETCTPGGRACCDCLACGVNPVDAGVETICCRPGGAACTLASQNECCSGQCIGDFCFCKSNGNPCTLDTQCCSFNCDGTTNQCAPAA